MVTVPELVCILATRFFRKRAQLDDLAFVKIQNAQVVQRSRAEFGDLANRLLPDTQCALIRLLGFRVVMPLL